MKDEARDKWLKLYDDQLLLATNNYEVDNTYKLNEFSCRVIGRRHDRIYKKLFTTKEKMKEYEHRELHPKNENSQQLLSFDGERSSEAHRTIIDKDGCSKTNPNKMDSRFKEGQ